MELLTQRALLVVDDEPDILEILVECLEPLQLQIFKALNGKEACEVLHNNEVHSVLSDISMPVMSGFELLTSMRVEFPDIPTVILTAYGDKESIREALRLGALDFLEKPFKNTEVLEVVTRAIEIGIRKRRVIDLSTKEASSDDNVSRVFDLKQQKRMIGLLETRHNKERKKRA